jgi:hypothetical protein
VVRLLGNYSSHREYSSSRIFSGEQVSETGRTGRADHSGWCALHRNCCAPPSMPAVLGDNAASTGPCGAGPARHKTARIKTTAQLTVADSAPPGALRADGVHPPCTWCSHARHNYHRNSSRNPRKPIPR